MPRPEQLTIEHETEQERWTREGFDGWDIFQPDTDEEGSDGNDD